MAHLNGHRWRWHWLLTIDPLTGLQFCKPLPCELYLTPFKIHYSVSYHRNLVEKSTTNPLTYLLFIAIKTFWSSTIFKKIFLGPVFRYKTYNDMFSKYLNVPIREELIKKLKECAILSVLLCCSPYYVNVYSDGSFYQHKFLMRLEQRSGTYRFFACSIWLRRSLFGFFTEFGIKRVKKEICSKSDTLTTLFSPRLSRNVPILLRANNH